MLNNKRPIKPMRRPFHTKQPAPDNESNDQKPIPFQLPTAQQAMSWANSSAHTIDAGNSMFPDRNAAIAEPSPPSRASTFPLQTTERQAPMGQPVFTWDAPGKPPLPSVLSETQTAATGLPESNNATRTLLEHMQVPDLERAVQRWKGLSKDLDQERMHVQKLRADSIRQEQQINDLKRHIVSLDGFLPAFDEDIQADFIQLNQKVRSLAMYLKQIMEHTGHYLADLLADTGFFWPQGINPKWTEDNRGHRYDDSKTKRLLIHIIWRFLDKAVLDRDYPFSAFSSSLNLEDQTQLAPQLHEIYYGMRLKNVTKPTVRAAWRISSMQELAEREKSYSTEADVCNRLKTQFINLLSKLPDASFREGLYSSEQGGNSGNHYRATFQAAVRFAKRVNCQKAEYSLEMPSSINEGNFEKGKDEEHMTSNGIGVGIDGIDDEETSGTINFVMTPMLVKWGDVRGQYLDTSVCLVKALVDIEAMEDEGKETVNAMEEDW